MLFLGELALDGRVRAIDGVLPMVIDAFAHGCKTIVLPEGNAEEAAYITGARILPVRSLRQAVDCLRETAPFTPYPNKSWDTQSPVHSADFSEIKGQQGAKRAAEIAVAGGHNYCPVQRVQHPPDRSKTKHACAQSIPSINARNASYI
jgi:magnesium chelatase family protein